MDHQPEKPAAIELRRAYESWIELAAGAQTAIHQPIEEYRALYREAFQVFTRGDLQKAELMARAVRHLCRAAWCDAKIKYLEGHAEDLPHLPGLTDDRSKRLDQSMEEIEARLARMKLTGPADRFGSRARKHLQRIRALPDQHTLLGEAFQQAAYEYCLATEALHFLDMPARVA